tara:strand:- start:1478 stop:3391 length:1914 start_codon:yes stop_codon:yes gene_type:complete
MAKPFKPKKHEMDLQDLARILDAANAKAQSKLYGKAQSKVLGGAEGPVRGASTDPSYSDERVGAGLRGMFGGQKQPPERGMSERETLGRMGDMFTGQDPATLYLQGESVDPYETKTYGRMFGGPQLPPTHGAGYSHDDIEAEQAYARERQAYASERSRRLDEYSGGLGEGPFMELGGFTSEQERGIQSRQQQSYDEDRARRLDEYSGGLGEGPFMELGGFTSEQELGIELGLLGGMAERGEQDLWEIEADLEREQYIEDKRLYDYSDDRGMGPKMEYGGFTRGEDQRAGLTELRKQYPGQQPMKRNGFTFGGQTGTRESATGDPYATEPETDAYGALTERGRKQKQFQDATKEQRRYGTTAEERDYRSSGYAAGVSGISTEQRLDIKDKARAGEDRETGDRFKRAEQLYERLGTEIRKETDPLRKDELIDQRNEQIQIGKEAAATLGLEGLVPGKFPYVEPVSKLARKVDIAASGSKGMIGDVMTQQLGAGAGYARGSLFRGTSYASTGAINGVMKALAGIFILFVFIGVFYMVFGPIYDSLIFNFTNIVSADGDPTLGGKDIPTLFDNVAKVVLVWVPLIVFAGALYKLTALVFEREAGTRTTEETEWDMLGSIEDSTNLDIGTDPSVFEAYGGGY